MWVFFHVNPEEEKESQTVVWTWIFDRMVCWSASNESSLNMLWISVFLFLCEKEKNLILECVCYMVLLEILIKIQSTIHFLFALNRKAHKMSMKSQKMQVFLSPCVNSLLIMVLISQSVKEAGNWFTAFTAPVMFCSARESVVLRRCNRQLQLSFINTPTGTCFMLWCSTG